MLHYPSDVDNDIEDLAKKVGVLRKVALRYTPPPNRCAGCGMPTGGIFCTDCTTSGR